MLVIYYLAWLNLLTLGLVYLSLVIFTHHNLYSFLFILVIVLELENSKCPFVFQALV